jgi:hypothetical protein
VVRERAVRSSVVVLLEELIEQGLPLRDAGGLAGLGPSPLLQGLLEAL